MNIFQSVHSHEQMYFRIINEVEAAKMTKWILTTTLGSTSFQHYIRRTPFKENQTLNLTLIYHKERHQYYSWKYIFIYVRNGLF